MAGGIGSRFWPWSQEAMPKQFLDILGNGHSLIQLTYKRFRKICPAENILVVSNTKYLNLIKSQIPEIKDENILLEPVRRNTAPCIAYASYKIRNISPSANIIVTPSDHLIENEKAFLEVISKGINSLAQKDQLITIGIEPTRADTGYGYIQYNKTSSKVDVKEVIQFAEKPDAQVAQDYINRGDFLWNSGIFIWSAEKICSELETFLPQVSHPFNSMKKRFGSPEERSMIDSIFPALEDISIDYGVMEKSESVGVIPASFGWSDLGTWGSLYEHLKLDENQNATFNSVPVTSNASGNIIKVSPGKNVVIEGLSDYIIVETENELLICSKKSEQAIKDFVAQLKP